MRRSCSRRACRSRTPAAPARRSGCAATSCGPCWPTRRRRGRRASSSETDWDPGSITDEALAAALRPAALRRGRTLVERGVTATVVRSAKPVALLHDVEATVRFLVPGDLAYARCDCADQPPCEHVVPAVHAFRALAPEEEAGLVELPPRGRRSGRPRPRLPPPAVSRPRLPRPPPPPARRRRSPRDLSPSCARRGGPRPARRGRRRRRWGGRQRPAARRKPLPDRARAVGGRRLRGARRPRRAARASPTRRSTRCGSRNSRARRCCASTRCAPAASPRCSPAGRAPPPRPRSAAGGSSGSARGSGRSAGRWTSTRWSTTPSRIACSRSGAPSATPRTRRRGRSPTSPPPRSSAGSRSPRSGRGS